MKKTVFKSIFVFAIFVVFISCKKQKEFSVTNSSTFTIPSSSSIINLPMQITTPQTTSNIETKVNNEGSSSKLIEKVTLTSLNLIINAPSNGNFNFLNSIEIYLSSPNQSEILVASKYDIPEDNLTTLVLNTESTDLKEYVKEKELTLRTKIITDKVVSYDLTITAEQIYFVKVALKNIFK